MALFDPPRSDTLAERRALVALSLVPGVGPGRIKALLAHFGSALAACSASRGALASVPGIGRQTAAAIAGFHDEAAVDDQMERAARAGAELVVLWDRRYPRLLRQIYDPPSFLWVLGSLRTSDDAAVAIVGTRRASDYGRRTAYDLAFELARRGVTVVSGLAYGIDAAAHRGSLEAGGRTIAVLGSGVDRIYPQPHNGLAREIAAQGAVVSEYPMGTGPDAANFPRRNRVVSGVSLGAVVVEAHETGGALITARLAVEQNREVFAVPSAVHSRPGAGSNRLIQRGHAKLVMTVDDVLEELEIAGVSAVTEEQEAPSLPELEPPEQRIYDVLEAEPKHIDRICTETEMDVSMVLVHLLNLEFKGMVGQMAGKQFFRR